MPVSLHTNFEMFRALLSLSSCTSSSTQSAHRGIFVGLCVYSIFLVLVLVVFCFVFRSLILEKRPRGNGRFGDLTVSFFCLSLHIHTHPLPLTPLCHHTTTNFATTITTVSFNRCRCRCRCHSPPPPPLPLPLTPLPRPTADHRAARPDGVLQYLATNDRAPGPFQTARALCGAPGSQLRSPRPRVRMPCAHRPRRR